MEINDNSFQQAISCPLKLYHTAGSGHGSGKLPYRHRNKLRLRDAVSLRFDNRRFTSDSIGEAEEETKKWLEEGSVAICGAVLRSGKFLTRIPILVKENNRFTIIQVHGKLRKRISGETIQWPVKGRSTAMYLLKAAYRSHILTEYAGVSDVQVSLFFPDRDFRSSADNLLQHLASVREEHPAEMVICETEKLFTRVDASKAVHHVLSDLPELVSHSHFNGMSVDEACTFISENSLESGNQLNVKIHNECKYCDFRLDEEMEKKGCWAEFFPNEALVFPGLHVHELIGHGNDSDIDQGFFYQEQVPYPEPFTSFEFIVKHGGEKLTIHQRRMLQLLKSKGEPVPGIWMRSGVSELGRVEYPLHFLDFEAATYALPLQRGMNSYQPVYFQFSCHTLFENGVMQHHEWLDDDPVATNVHEILVEKLHSIPLFLKGTIVQYSQFEYRALKNILKGFRRNVMRFGDEIAMLDDIMKGAAGKTGQGRFLDLSKIIEEYYYNRYMQGGIGLKQVLMSVLKWEKSESGKTRDSVQLGDITIDLLKEHEVSGTPDPYNAIELKGEKIDDGSEAMHAWLCLKNGLLTEEELLKIPVILRRYCSLDSYALLVLYRHLKELMNGMKDGEDLIIY